jgi:hypothetical protein
MPPSYVHRERVRFGDLDAMRHLNNVVFLRYFESPGSRSSAGSCPSTTPRTRRTTPTTQRATPLPERLREALEVAA